MAWVPPPPTEPITCPDSGVLQKGEKKDHAKSHIKRRGVIYGKIGLTTVTVTQDLLSGMQLVI